MFIILNTFGSVALFYYNKKSIKKEMKALLRSNPPLDKLVIIKVSNEKKGYQRIDKYEFMLKGKMYDIIKEETRNDTIVFHCINDTKEDELIASFSGLINDNTNNSGLLKNLKQIFNFMFLGAFIEEKQSKHLNFYSIFNHYLFDEDYKSIVLDVTTPPPRYIS